MEIRETREHIEHAHEEQNKRAGVLIIVLAAILAVMEMAGKEAQFAGLAANIERADLFSYYQAKTIRAALARSAVDGAGLVAPTARSAGWDQQVTEWKEAADRLDSDPKGGEGRKELLEKAREKEQERDHEVLKYHAFEYGSAVLQLAIVLASASVLIEKSVLELAAVAFGGIGILLGLIGAFAPAVLPF